MKQLCSYSITICYTRYPSCAICLVSYTRLNMATLFPHAFLLHIASVVAICQSNEWKINWSHVIYLFPLDLFLLQITLYFFILINLTTFWKNEQHCWSKLPHRLSLCWWSSQWSHWSHAFWKIFNCWACGLYSSMQRHDHSSLTWLCICQLSATSWWYSLSCMFPS